MRPPAVRHSFPVMGTVASIAVASHDVEVLGRPSVETALVEVQALLEELDSRFSHYRADSGINRALAGEPIDDVTRREVDHVLAECARLEDESGGVFVARHPRTGTIDTAGFVKGHAIQRAADLLTARGLEHTVVGVGGDVQCRGRAEADRPWRVAVQDPMRSHAVLAMVEATDLAVATSGRSERGDHLWSLGWQDDDPGALAAFTVVGPRIEEADAYATIGFAMGRDGIDWVAQRDGYASILVLSDGSMVSDAALVSPA